MKESTTAGRNRQRDGRDAEAIKAARQAAYDEMLPPLKKIAGEIRELLHSGDENALAKRHDVGSLIESVLKNEAEYGACAVEQLGESLGVSPVELYQYRTVASVYGREEIATLAARQMASGKRLQWGHLNSLSEIMHGSDRRKFEDLAFENSWSPQALVKAIAGIPSGQMTDIPIDRAHHALKGFRLEEGQLLHLVGDDEEKFSVTIKKLLADETPVILGTSVELGQVAETTDGRFVLWVDTGGWFAVDIYATLADLASDLWA